MKVAIITFHFPHNVGAVLQCFALQKYLEGEGHNVSVIDYRPEYHVRMYRSIRNPFTEATDYVTNYVVAGKVQKTYKWIRHFASVLLSNIKHKVVKEREKAFSIFISDNLNLTRRYNDLNELIADPPSADAYVTGSDQVWNSNITNGRLDPAYFLTYGDSNIIRVAYAVSADIQDKDILDYKTLTKEIDAICLREKSTSSRMEELLGREVKVGVDPTLLLPKSSYEQFVKISNNYDYVLFYGLSTKQNKELVKSVLDKVKREYDLPIIDISPINWNISAEETHRVISPSEFLSYIHNASVVVTNSFHGTVFSLIFNREIWCVLPSLKGMRIIDLMENVGLQKRIIRKSNEICLINPNNRIDYNQVSVSIENTVKSSKEFLDKVLVRNCFES